MSACIFTLNYSHENGIIDFYEPSSDESTNEVSVEEDPTLGIIDGTLDSNSSIINEENLVPSILSKDLNEDFKDKNLPTIIDSASTLSGDATDSKVNTTGQPSQVITGDHYFNISLPDGKNLIECKDFIILYRNKSKVKIPYSCREYGLAIRSYLSKNPGIKLKIIASYDDIENESIGAARADYLINLLSGIGIESSSIVAEIKKQSLDIAKGYTTGGIELQLFDSTRLVKPARDNARAAALPSVNSNSALLREKFTTGFQGEYYYGDTRFTSFLSQIKDVIKTNPSARIYIYSYADKSNDTDESFFISRDNASTARKLMVQNGIDKKKIIAVAQGAKPSGAAGTNQCILLIIK